jgi:Uma2 family endonuclease
MSHTYRTVQDVIDRLGIFPLERIRLIPPPGTATEHDVFRARREIPMLCEIFDGVLVEKPPGMWESIISTGIIARLGEFIDEHQFPALISGAAGPLWLLDRQLRMPDITLMLRSQFPNGLPKEAVWRAYPDLAVHVLREMNTEAEMNRRLDEYFQVGTSLVWLVDRQAHTVTVYFARKECRVVDIDGTLDGAPVLPGFTLPVRDIFDF